MTKKHIKIIEGHSIKEWESKYQKKIAKGKIKVFNNEKDLIDYAIYWKIDGKYYQVPGAFEWYTKSLRKSKGLTIALTCTSILATFFLTAALVQSQVKWKADKYGLSVSFYAVDGTFSDGTKSKVISGITKGTKLKNIEGYDKCIPSLADHEFIHWHVDDGQTGEIPFYEDDAITENVSLKAYYELNPENPVLFGGPGLIPGETCDSWETVLSVVRQGKEAFINAYCKDQPSFDTDKEQALLEFMDSPVNRRRISVGSVGDYEVRVIGIGQDHEYDGQDDHDDLVTFEFNECIYPVSYSFVEYGTPFYTKSGSADSEEKQDYCGLKTYTEDIVLNQLPLLIRENMKTVKKRTLQVHGGFKYGYNENLQSWTFDKSCLDGTGGDQTNKLEIVETKEKLFSLSLDEIGATKYEFEYTIGEDEEGKPITDPGRQYMLETTQYDKDLMDRVSLTRGEGFLDESNEYTGAYQFYTHDWYDKEAHTDKIKRMKRYFIGTGDDSINASYRLRSIYIPNSDRDVDDPDDAKNRPSGNKDYRPFETWNITSDGCIGNRKISGLVNPDKPGERYYFACGDMAWNSAFVSPAFCL